MSLNGFGFEQIAYLTPGKHQSVESLVREAGCDTARGEQALANGLRVVPVSGPDRLSDLIHEAISQMVREDPSIPQRTFAIIASHSLPCLAPDGYPFFEKCIEGLGLSNVPRIAASGQPCSIVHMAIQLTGAWLRTIPEASLLFIAAEKAYRAIDRIFFGSVMGDAIVVALASVNALHNRVVASVSQSHIIATAGELSPSDDIARFRQENPYRIREAVRACLRRADLTMDEISYIVPHTPYFSIWDNMATLLGFPRDRILTNYLPETGHMNSNDVLVHYDRAVREGIILDGANVLLVSPGFGGTRGCTIICR